MVIEDNQIGTLTSGCLPLISSLTLPEDGLIVQSIPIRFCDSIPTFLPEGSKYPANRFWVPETIERIVFLLPEAQFFCDLDP